MSCRWMLSSASWQPSSSTCTHRLKKSATGFSSRCGLNLCMFRHTPCALNVCATDCPMCDLINALPLEPRCAISCGEKLFLFCHSETGLVSPCCASTSSVTDGVCVTCTPSVTVSSLGSSGSPEQAPDVIAERLKLFFSFPFWVENGLAAGTSPGTSTSAV